MELEVAISLLKRGIEKNSTPQHWAELGAGRGLFTRALATLLPSGSTLHAMDRDRSALNSIIVERTDLSFERSTTDFVRDPLALKQLDGILMANALHFAPQKILLAKNLKKSLKETGKLILVEYDTDEANAWVPYPVSFNTLTQVAHAMGFHDVQKLGEVPSLYQRASIYAAVLS